MATKYLAPDPIQSTFFIPGSNTPASGGQLFFYVAGSSTKQTVYKDNAGAVAWTNPIVLDSGGNLPSGGEVWFSASATYKVIFAPATDTDPPVSPYWTKDNLAGMNDPGTASTTSEWITGSTPTFVGASAFSVVGDQTATYDVNRRVKTVNTGGTVYGTVTSVAFASGSTVVGMVNDSGNLDAGISQEAYALLDALHPSVPALYANKGAVQSSLLTMTSNALLGRSTASTGAIEAITISTATPGAVSLQPGSTLALNVRNYLVSNTTFWVGTSGADTVTSGLSSTTPFRTVQYAWETIRDNYDMGGNQNVLQIMNGAYGSTIIRGMLVNSPGNMIVKPSTPSGFLIQGNSVTPSSVVFSTSANSTDALYFAHTEVHIEGVRVQATGSGICRGMVADDARLVIGVVEFSTCSFAHLHVAGNAAACTVNNNYVANGSTLRHVLVETQGMYECQNKTITMSNQSYGTNAAQAFAVIDQMSLADFTGALFGGNSTITGRTYEAQSLSLLILAGTVLPGNVAGSSFTGAQVI